LFKKLESPLFLKNAAIVTVDTFTVYQMNIADDCVRKCNAKDIYYYRGLFYDIYTQLTEMHKLNIVHGDVKPANILEFDKFFTLCDFDFCGPPSNVFRICNDRDNYDSVKYFVTIGAVDGKNFGHTKRGDLYSLIMVFFMMLCDCNAYIKELNEVQYSGDIYASVKELILIRTRYIETQLLPLQIKEVNELYSKLEGIV